MQTLARYLLTNQYLSLSLLLAALVDTPTGSQALRLLYPVPVAAYLGPP